MAFPPTDWGDFTTDEYQVGAPGTSYSFERWFRNPVAIAQGAPGAPRVQWRALGGKRYLPAVGNNTAIVGLADVTELGGQLYFSVTGGSNTCSIQFSINGGVSWSTAQTLYSGGPTTRDLLFSVRLDSGDWVWGTLGGTLTIPAGIVDAVRLNGVGPGAMLLYQPIIEGGRA